MWIALLAVVGLGCWRVAQAVIEASTETTVPDLTQSPKPSVPAYEVCWAYVPFDDDPCKGKIRPVLLLEKGAQTLTVLELRSERGPTTEHMAWIPISKESAQSFDRKHHSGWVKIAQPRILPTANLVYGSHPTGYLTADDACAVWGAMLEYMV